MTLPSPLRDLVYVGLRLALLERVAGYKRLPIVVDDSFGILDLPKRVLIGKMLKGIGTQTQVIHRRRAGDPAGDERPRGGRGGCRQPQHRGAHRQDAGADEAGDGHRARRVSRRE